MKKLLCLCLLSASTFADYYVFGALSTNNSDWEALGSNFAGGSGSWNSGERVTGGSLAVGASVTKGTKPYSPSLLAELGYKQLGSVKKSVSNTTAAEMKTRIPYVAAGISQKFLYYRLSYLFGVAQRILKINSSASVDIKEQNVATPFMTVRWQYELLNSSLGLQYSLIPGVTGKLADAKREFQPQTHELSVLLQYNF